MEVLARAAGAAIAFSAVAACGGEAQGPTADPTRSTSSPVVSDTIHFAVTGDFGGATPEERDVANLITGWAPDFVITVGDNNYPDGAASTIDTNIGQFYHSFISPYAGAYGAGAAENRFFPSLGNHDWDTAGAAPYLSYFTLPGNERYYDFVRGSVHFFAVDSDPREPDGTSPTSAQGLWLKNALAAAPEPWKVVYFHHTPFSSGVEAGSSTWMQWPFQEWGASVVLAGHEHVYERFSINGFPYIVNGLGGEEYFDFGAPLPGSVARFTGDFGAIRATASSTSLQFQFFDRNNVLIDSYAVGETPPPPPPPPPPGSPSTVANAAPVTIPSSGPALPYPSKITVSGQPTNPSKVTVTLQGLGHTYPDDLDVILVGPRGQKVVLMSDTGGGNTISGVNLTFDDGAAASLPDSARIASGTYRPTDFVSGDSFPAPAPAGPYATTLSSFANLDPNGDWVLYVVDDEAGDSGTISGGWSLSFSYPSGGGDPPPPPPPAPSGANVDVASTAVCAIPSSGAAGPYPAPIVVSGLPSSPTKVTVSLHGLSHTYPDDLDILLVGPRGQTVVLMSDVGGGDALASVNLTFDDAAASSLPDNAPIASGTFKPTDVTTSAADSWPGPAPAGPYGAALGGFAGVDPNGTWSLYIVDDEAGDSGTLAGGWTLHFSY